MVMNAGLDRAADHSAGAKPLSGIRVLEVGRHFAAPMCAQILGDLGADVVKVERLGVGDDFRAYGPAFLKDKEGKPSRESSGYLACNRNKRSIEIDFATPEGQSTLRQLAERCDIFIENFKVGNLARYGLDEQSVRAAHPGVIYVSVTGFGQTGPYAQRPGTDGCFQAMSGLQSLTGHPDGPPEKVGVVIIDLITGLYAAIAALAALRHREVNRGGGQAIDMALLDCAMSSISYRAIEYVISGETPARFGNGQPGVAPSQFYRCSDGLLHIQAFPDADFKRLCLLLGLDWVSADERFQRRADRATNLAALNAILEPAFADRPLAETYEMLVAGGIICAPVNDVPAALGDAQVRHRAMLVDMPHSLSGTVSLIASPMRFSATPVTYDRTPPMLGQDTQAVLADWLGATP